MVDKFEITLGIKVFLLPQSFLSLIKIVGR